MPGEPPLPPGRGSADLFAKTPADKVVVLRTRQWMLYPFSAPGWTDLRVGFFLSLTKHGGPPPVDDVTGLAETIGTSGIMAIRDHYWIGVKTRTDAMPATRGVIFAGFSNIRLGALGPGVLSASDNGTGTGTDYWWPHNGGNPNSSAIILQEADPAHVVFSPPGLQQHFPLNLTGAHGYAVMLGLRFQRPNANQQLWTMEVKTDGVNADMLYSNTPTEEILLSNLQTWPPAIQMGPIQLAAFVPDALYAYWPFRLSRLRIHSVIVYDASP
jgi:hypothetical protein